MVERILGLTILVGIIARDILGFGVPNNPVMIVCGSILGLMYLFGNWWTNKPTTTNARTVSVMILYGLTSSCLIFALLFHVYYFPGADELTVLSGILLVISITVDFVWSAGLEKVINEWTIWRFGILSLLVLILFFIPKDLRINYTYRGYPDFLKFYEANKTKMEFDDLRIEFFNNKVEP